MPFPLFSLSRSGLVHRFCSLFIPISHPHPDFSLQDDNFVPITLKNKNNHRALHTTLEPCRPNCQLCPCNLCSSFALCKNYFFKHFFLLRFYLFIFREGKRGRKRGRETSMCGCLLHAPYWGPGLQPRHVLWLGIEQATLWFAGRPQSTGPHQPGQKLLLGKANSSTSTPGTILLHLLKNIAPVIPLSFQHYHFIPF